MPSEKRFFPILIFCVAGAHVTAGGPSHVALKSVFLHKPGPIPYRLDSSRLANLTKEETHKLVHRGLATWHVPTASVQFQADKPLNVTIGDLVDFEAVVADDKIGNLVILDSAGTIFEEIFGRGSRDTYLGATTLKTEAGRIHRFYSLLNGHRLTEQSLAVTVAHEAGHALGLDHTQINADVVAGAATDHLFPLMLPTDKKRTAGLHPDDAAWLSLLYPSHEFSKRYGIIGGLLRWGDKSPVLGANVVAVAQELAGGKKPPEVGEYYRFSCVSDFRLERTGEFSIPVLPGKYKLFIEPIRSPFVGDSSVGPHAKHPRAPSFTRRVKPKTFEEIHTVTAGDNMKVGPLEAN